MSSEQESRPEPYRLTPRAKEDLRGIWNYTVEVWGESQAERYLTLIHQRCAWLAVNPRAGRHRSDIREGYYGLPVGSHLIFYLMREGGIDVIGIPHQEMDIPDHFQ